MLEVSFVRRRGSRDHVYVTRSDATTTDWAFPSYGDALPHDLVHLIVEEGLGLTEGFWGLVDDHVDVGLVNNHPTLVRGGIPLVDLPDVDFRGLVQAEEAVALLGSPLVQVELQEEGGLAVARVSTPMGPTASVRELGDVLDFALPDGVTPDDVVAIHARLREVGARWRDLDDGAAITLTFTR